MFASEPFIGARPSLCSKIAASVSGWWEAPGSGTSISFTRSNRNFAACVFPLSACAINPSTILVELRITIDATACRTCAASGGIGLAVTSKL